MAAGQVARLTHDTVGEVAIEQEVLTERVTGGQAVAGDDVA